MRDFIEETLKKEYGDEWIEHCGVTEERVEIWKDRQEQERKRQRTSSIDERLLYYADFYDLKPILRKNWSLFEPCFGKLKRFDVYLDTLEIYRNPEAHRRALLPYQKSLIEGISGDIRTSITLYKSQQAPENEFFPRIEYVRDSLGNVATSDDKIVITNRMLRPGDEITFMVEAWDPYGEPLEYSLNSGSLESVAEWSANPTMVWTVAERDIRLNVFVDVRMRSKRKFHANRGDDDSVSFEYTVLPK